MKAEGFVFGKFYPLHRGHLGLIEFARTQCEHLTILVCCSYSEKIFSPSARIGWLKDSLNECSDITIKMFEYDEAELPNTSVSSHDVSQAWSEVFKPLLPGVNLVVTSEGYGEFVANHMGIEHVSYQPARSDYPISGSAIRNDLLKHWEFLPPAVQRHCQKRVVLLGSESTGKSTLAAKLAAHFNGVLVEEVGRELIPDTSKMKLHDLIKVANSHAQQIDKAAQSTAPLIVIDTDIYITQSYAKFIFGELLELADELYQKNYADLRLYLNTDTPFIQDGTRMGIAKRGELDRNHKKVLRDYEIKYTEVSGSFSERENSAIGYIEALFNF